MPIPESQLETWSNLGSVAQSRDTYATVKNALQSNDAPYAQRDYTIFLQGSYANDTNVYADSDVDVVIQLNSTFQPDIERLAEAEQVAFDRTYPNAQYHLSDFKSDVLAQLRRKFPYATTPGTKAIHIAGAGSRRNADVLAAIQYRRYRSFNILNTGDYIEGLQFICTDGTVITNYPKLHSENCTAKHQATSEWFKPTVRIFKNMRNRMVDDGMINDGLAPSYFIEGMLYNVPKGKFGTSFEDTVVNSLNWLMEADLSKLKCANEQVSLLGDNSAVRWKPASCTAFLSSLVDFWNNW